MEFETGPFVVVSVGTCSPYSFKSYKCIAARILNKKFHLFHWEICEKRRFCFIIQFSRVTRQCKLTKNGNFTPQTQTLVLRRNPLGQLGFHVQSEGLVADVEPAGLAYQAGLRIGCRLVEVEYNLDAILHQPITQQILRHALLYPSICFMKLRC